jgi:hypothetical protein
MITEQELRDFLVEAKKGTYALGDGAPKKKLDDGSTEIIYQRENYCYRDRYFGGEPYAGEEVVFDQRQPLWAMNYLGRVHDDCIEHLPEIYEFLQVALRGVDKELPYRGPQHFSKQEFTYRNIVEGGIDFFAGREEIYIRENLVYTALYHGGFVDKVKEE